MHHSNYSNESAEGTEISSAAAAAAAAATDSRCVFAAIEAANGATNMVPNVQPSFVLAHVFCDDSNAKLAMESLLEELRACAHLAAHSAGAAGAEARVELDSTASGYLDRSAVGSQSASAGVRANSMRQSLFTVVNLAAQSLAAHQSTLPLACLLVSVLNGDEANRHQSSQGQNKAAAASVSEIGPSPTVSTTEAGTAGDAGADSIASVGAVHSVNDIHAVVLKVKADELVTSASFALAASASKAMAILVPGDGYPQNASNGDDNDGHNGRPSGNGDGNNSLLLTAAIQHTNQSAALECCLALHACGVVSLSDDCRLAAAAASRVGAAHLAWLQAHSAISGNATWDSGSTHLACLLLLGHMLLLLIILNCLSLFLSLLLSLFSLVYRRSKGPPPLPRQPDSIG